MFSNISTIRCLSLTKLRFSRHATSRSHQVAQEKYERLKKVVKDGYQFNLQHTIAAVLINKQVGTDAKAVQAEATLYCNQLQIMRDLEETKLLFATKDIATKHDTRFLGGIHSSESGCVPVLVGYGVNLFPVLRSSVDSSKCKFDCIVDLSELQTRIPTRVEDIVREVSNTDVSKSSNLMHEVICAQKTDALVSLQFECDVRESRQELISNLLKMCGVVDGYSTLVHRIAIGPFSIETNKVGDQDLETNSLRQEMCNTHSNENGTDDEIDAETEGRRIADQHSAINDVIGRETLSEREVFSQIAQESDDIFTDNHGTIAPKIVQSQQFPSICSTVTFGELLGSVSTRVDLPLKSVIKNNSMITDLDKLGKQLKSRKPGLYSIYVDNHPRVLVERHSNGNVRVEKVFPVFHQYAKRELARIKQSSRANSSK